MIGWENVLSRDYDEAVVNGTVDDDLDNMLRKIEIRIKERDGVRRCPDCGELLESEHEHDGYAVRPLPVRKPGTHQHTWVVYEAVARGTGKRFVVDRCACGDERTWREVGNGEG